MPTPRSKRPEITSDPGSRASAKEIVLVVGVVAPDDAHIAWVLQRFGSIRQGTRVFRWRKLPLGTICSRDRFDEGQIRSHTLPRRSCRYDAPCTVDNFFDPDCHHVLRGSTTSQPGGRPRLYAPAMEPSGRVAQQQNRSHDKAGAVPTVVPR